MRSKAEHPIVVEPARAERLGVPPEGEVEAEASPEAEVIERELERAVERLQANADQVTEALAEAPESSWTDSAKLVAREVGLRLYSLAHIVTGTTIAVKSIERGWIVPGILIGMGSLVGALQMEKIRQIALARDLERRSGTAAA